MPTHHGALSQKDGRAGAEGGDGGGGGARQVGVGIVDCFAPPPMQLVVPGAGAVQKT